MCLVIFGFRGVDQAIGRGEFQCPQCAQVVPYTHTNVRRFFTLFFIPIIPAGDLGDYIQCSVCRNTYTPAVLNASPTTTNTTFRRTVNEAVRRLVVGITLADGQVEPMEADRAVRLAQTVLGESYTRYWFDQDVARFKNEDLLASMRTVGRMTDDEGREVLLSLALQVAAADGVIPTPETDLINDIADALGITKERTSEIMHATLEAQPKTLSAG